MPRTARAGWDGHHAESGFPTLRRIPGALRSPRPPLPRREPVPHPRPPLPARPRAAGTRRRHLRREAQPHLAAPPDHRHGPGRRRPARPRVPALEGHRHPVVHPRDQLPAPPVVRTLPRRQHPAHGHDPALGALPSYAATVHRLSLPGQFERSAGQGGPRRGVGGADDAAERRHGARRRRDARRRARRHRRARARLPARLPHRGTRRRLPGDETARPAAQSQRVLPARGGTALLPRGRDDHPHPHHPRTRPGAHRTRPRRRLPAPGLRGRSAAGRDQRPLRIAGLGHPQHAGSAVPDGVRSRRVPRLDAHHPRRRRDAQRLLHRPDRLRHHTAGPGTHPHQGAGIGAFGR